MDRDEALRLLKGGSDGVAEWNQRREAGEEIPDLRVADLEGANLTRANLTRANLTRANLTRADLEGVNLTRADLHGANLSGAFLEGADLSVADLHGANLSGAFLEGADLFGAILRRADIRGADIRGANLHGANLHGANFNRADLNRADLEEAVCRATIFADVDLSEVKGLDKIRHEGPSTVGIDTLVRSQGKIPEVFLRGCGVPDALIAYLPSLIGAMSPIQFYSCFISYSTKDEAFAKRLYLRMRDEGLRVWFAPEDIQGGKKLHEQIDEAIRVYEKLLLVLSPNSMNSEWVRTEIRKARKAEIKEGKRKQPLEGVKSYTFVDLPKSLRWRHV